MNEPRTVAVVIPARLGSRRFPRKVLARDTGKFLIEHVWEAVVGCPGVSRVIVATDSEEVLDAVSSFGGDAVMTSPDHVSGTDRVAEVAQGLDEEIIVNVQGDEPLIEHRDVQALIDLFDGGETDMTTLAVRRNDEEGFADPNIVKAVIAADGRALYFSRASTPYVRDRDESSEEASIDWWQHLGVYAYRRTFLKEITALEPSPLEQRERLEQLRALENGYVIRVGETNGYHIGVDTPEDYREFIAGLAGK